MEASAYLSVTSAVGMKAIGQVASVARPGGLSSQKGVCRQPRHRSGGSLSLIRPARNFRRKEYCDLMQALELGIPTAALRF